MSQIGSYALPVLLAAVLLHGLYKRVPVFDAFLNGAATGLQTAVRLLPTLVGMLTAVAMLQTSGAVELLATALAPVASLIGLPAEVLPLALIHPVSGSGATAVLADLLHRFGPDSVIGNVASVMCGSGETTLYAVTVYYGSCGVTRTRHTLVSALAADCAVAVLSGIGVRLLLA